MKINIAIAARREDRLSKLAQDIQSRGGKALILPMDVTDRAQIEAQFAFVSTNIGDPTILINNAGLPSNYGFLEATAADTASVFSVNQMAAWNVAQHFARKLVAAELKGSIVNIASITGLRATGGAASYAVSKAAVAHMTRVQALELARHGIRANAIAPGYFDTDLNQDFLSSEVGQKLVKRIPMRRTGRLEDLDGLLLLLASCRSAFMTGAVIPVDGGHLVSSL